MNKIDNMLIKGFMYLDIRKQVKKYEKEHGVKIKITKFQVYQKDENGKDNHVGILKKHNDKTGEWERLDG